MLLLSSTSFEPPLWSLAWKKQSSTLAISSLNNIHIISNNSTSTLPNAHKRTIRSVAFNDSYLASASFDATAALWDISSLVCSAVLQGHENEVKCVAWNSNGLLLATCGRDKSVWIWEDIGNGDFECISILQSHSQDVKFVVWHPTLQILLSTSYDDSIKLYKEFDDDWVCFDTLLGHSSTVWAADFDASGDFIVSVSDDKSVRIWQVDQDQYKCTAILENAHSRTIYSVSWNKVNDFIATCGSDNSIRIFKYNREERALSEIETMKNAHSEFDINCVSWCSDPKGTNILASCGDDGCVKTWKIEE